MREMPYKLRVYVLLIICIGIFCVFLAVRNFHIQYLPKILFFVVLNGIAESLAIKQRGTTHISVGFAIGLAAVFSFNTNVVALIGFLSMLIWVEYEEGKFYHVFNSPVHKRLFNCCAYAITLSVAFYSYQMIDKVDSRLLISNLSIPGIMIGVFAFIIAEIGIFFQLLALLENKPFKNIFRNNTWTVINLLAVAPLGVITAIAYNNYGWFAVLLFFGPLLLARYSFKLYMDMRHVYFETIKALSNAVEAKDKYTNGHSYRVADYAVAISERMGFGQDEIDRIKTAAILHDIGKIGISDNILNKPGHLEDNEYALIQRHPEIGSKILSEVEFLKDVSQIIKYHHERFDGKGYPEGLKGAEIPMEASILAVADAYDAMTSDRPYRKAMDRHTAMNILIKESGVQFNPIVVKAFRDYLNTHMEEMAHVG